ncbi:MAG: hypothetical protein FWE05_13595 [Defluviitaleaceae bacterium]|nr:hypothetical protein [Defluviitaleaceae bacterium]
MKNSRFKKLATAALVVIMAFSSVAMVHAGEFVSDLIYAEHTFLDLNSRLIDLADMEEAILISYDEIPEGVVPLEVSSIEEIIQMLASIEILDVPQYQNFNFESETILHMSRSSIHGEISYRTGHGRVASVRDGANDIFLYSHVTYRAIFEGHNMIGMPRWRTLAFLSATPYTTANTGAFVTWNPNPAHAHVFSNGSRIDFSATGRIHHYFLVPGVGFLYVNSRPVSISGQWSI